MMKIVLTTVWLLVPACSAFAQSEQPAAPAAPAAWYERLRFSGDFRSRYEGFYRTDDETRNRARLRFRLRLDTAVNEDVSFQLQVASGDPGTGISTNQTFTDFFTVKPFNLDRAFLAYNPQTASAITLGAGKFDAPQATTQMIFDEDLNFEGAWEEVSWSPREAWEVTVGGLQTAVNEHSSAPDAYLLAGFGAAGVELGPHRLEISAANYAWGREDDIAVASASGALDAVLTNAVIRDGAGRVVGFASRFNVVDVIAEATLQTGRPQYPVRLLADIARNTRAADERGNGVWLEAEYGQPRQTGHWSLGYTYGWVEQDVTPSAFVFSDIPGTNLRLHMAEASYIIKTGLSLDTTLHLTRPLIPESATDPNHWLARLHLAAVVRF